MKKNKFVSMDPILMIVEKSLFKLPAPSSISFLWNMGFLLGFTLMFQIITGVVLAMGYIPSVHMAFESVIHMTRDMDSGWILRYCHANGASMFFVFIYIHMARGIYFNSPVKMPMVWMSGIIILLCTMGTAFMGYVLPWGQMSFWGATVITSMLTAIPYVGSSTAQWIWGNFSVSQPTLNRFLSLHFALPFLLAGLVIVHLILLHKTGSSNPLGIYPDVDKISFFPYFAIKDSVPLFLIFIFFSLIISLNPNLLGDVENFSPASMSTTPAHIMPEWYFLFAYAILRSIPSKLGGVLAMLFSILVLSILIFNNKTLNSKFKPFSKIFFWLFVVIVVLLTWIGSNPVEDPFIMMGQFFTLSYFLLCLLIFFFSLKEYGLFTSKV